MKGVHTHLGQRRNVDAIGETAPKGAIGRQVSRTVEVVIVTVPEVSVSYIPAVVLRHAHDTDE